MKASDIVALAKGDRVRARCTIDYVTFQVVIAEGSAGVVDDVTHAGFLAMVRWEGRTDALSTAVADDALERVDA